MNLGERLKQARDSLGYTQKDMAAAIKTNPQTWRVYESGKSVPGGNVLEALARMGFNVNWILTGEGPIRLRDQEKERLLYEEAHNLLRKRIKEFAAATGWRIFGQVIPDNKFRSYISNKEYIPTKDELINLCRLVNMDTYCEHRNIDYNNFISTITSESKHPASESYIFNHKLLALVMQAMLEYVSKTDKETSYKFSHMAVDIFFMIEELRKDIPPIDDIKSLIHLLSTVGEQMEKGLIDMKGEELVKLIDKIILRSAKKEV